ncbi:MAG: 50S ribosomal protein L25 [Chloroflexi bacterium]|nr:50S ribosomal protein L25 [Chloroflexota bacterium]
MAEKYVLDAQSRTIVGKKVSQLRRQGLVPAVVYGARLAPVHIQIPYRPLEVTLMKAGGTHLIDIQVDGGTYTVLAREVQRDILRSDILHVDFFAVDESTKIRVEVPIHFVNESPAVEARLGVLMAGSTTLTLETLPSKLLSVVEVDISGLAAVGDSVYVRDLNLGPDVTIVSDPDEMIVRVSQTAAARSIEEEALEEAESTPAEVEIIQKGKIEEDED